MTGSHYDRATITFALDLLDEGATVKEVALETGATDSTVREWRRRRLDDPTLSWLPSRVVVHDAQHGSRRAYRELGCRCAECRSYANVSSAASRRRSYLAMPPRMTSSVGSRRRIEALMAIGWPASEIAVAAGLTASGIQNVKHRAEITQEKRAAICRAYNALSMTLGPSNRTRGWARKYGYAPPLAWDDDTIDDPMARPNFGRHEFGYASRKLPDPDVLVAEVNQHGVMAVAHRYKAERSTVHKALRRAGYRASHTGDSKQTPIYRRDAA